MGFNTSPLDPVVTDKSSRDKIIYCSPIEPEIYPRVLHAEIIEFVRERSVKTKFHQS